MPQFSKYTKIMVNYVPLNAIELGKLTFLSGWECRGHYTHGETLKKKGMLLNTQGSLLNERNKIPDFLPRNLEVDFINNLVTIVLS